MRQITIRILIIIGVVIALSGVVSAMNIDATNKYAWGENIGWINFGSTEGDVDVTATTMDGYAWGENVGWISLTCNNTSSCGTVDYGVTISGSDVSGYAWGENVGWISFSCSNTSSCGTVDYGVTIDTATGIFSGYAWGENVGWIVFNCATTSSCGTVDYKLQAGAVSSTATPTPTGPSGVYILPPAGTTPTPTGTPIVPPVTSPGVTPSTFPTPTSLPPGESPGSSPSVSPSVSPVVGAIDSIAEFFDSIATTVLGLFGTGNPALCSGPVGFSACATTAIPFVAIVLAFAATLLQSEWIAVGSSMLQFLGIRRRPKVWGVVYDSRTKHQIPLAKLELFDANNRLLETRYADRDGRYGFLMSPASLHEQELRVQIKVSKLGFAFPSVSMTMGTDFIVYDNIYRGGQVVMSGDALLHYNIPMDPIQGYRLSLLGFGQNLINPLGEKLLALGFYVGLVMVPLNWFFAPTTKNLIIGIVFIALNVFRSFVLHRPHGVTTDAQTGKRMPFALVVLNDLQGNRQNFAVSDEHGRFILSGEQNKDYEVVAYTPANVSPQRSVTKRVRGIRRMSTRAWITNNLKI